MRPLRGALSLRMLSRRGFLRGRVSPSREWFESRRIIQDSVERGVSTSRLLTPRKDREARLFLRVCWRNHVGNLVDSASSHTLVSKIKPCMSKYKRFIL